MGQICDELSGILTTIGFPPEMVQQVEQRINNTVLGFAAVIHKIMS
jgi:diacylglycerol kinase family enzyme